MPDASRPRCQIAGWCAKPPHPPEDGCSIAVRRDWRDVVDRTVDQFVAAIDAAHNPAVGGTVNDHLTVPADRVTDVTLPADPDGVDVNRWIAAIRKANDAADEYQSIAYELEDLISRYRGLKSRQVQSPEDGEDTAPQLLSSSLVKLDMTEHLCRLERFQVAAMGAAGAWHMLGERWDAQCKEELAYEAEQRGEVGLAIGAPPGGLLCKCMNADCPNDHYTEAAVRRCRVCGCTDDAACENGCTWIEYDLCSECLGDAGGVVDATGIEYAATHGEEDGR